MDFYLLLLSLTETHSAKLKMERKPLDVTAS